MGYTRCDCGKTFQEETTAHAQHIKKCKVFAKALQQTHENAKRKLREDEMLKDQRKRQCLEKSNEATFPLEPESEISTTDEPAEIVDNIPFVRGLQSATSNQLPPQDNGSADIPANNGGCEGTSRPRRGFASRRLPKRYRDILPQGPGPIMAIPSMVSAQPTPPPSSASEFPSLPPVIDSTSTYRSAPNSFGIFREYKRQPLRDPDDEIPIESLTNFPLPSSVQIPPPDIQSIINPYPNISTWRLGSWFEEVRTERHLSQTRFTDLIENVLLASDFKTEELSGITGKKLQTLLDRIDQPATANASDNPNESSSTDLNGFSLAWKQSKVTIKVPTSAKARKQDPTISTSTIVEVEGLYHRCLTSVMKSAMEAPAAKSYHFEPFKTYWNKASTIPSDTKSTDSTTPSTKSVPEPPNSPLPASDAERIFDDLYTSDAWIEEHEKVLQLPPELLDDGRGSCKLPRAIAAYMFWSDATHVAQFGQAKMWPIYLFFGNQSKQTRCQSPLTSCHHVGHIPSLPIDIHDRIQKGMEEGKSASDQVLAHCRRELMHGVWSSMLDPKFLHAYRHGVVVQCGDGITRRIYPRVFTYSADYPERVLVATIRDLGNCPCPRCLVKKESIYQLGTARDRSTVTANQRIDNEARRRGVESARKLIYLYGAAVGNDRGEFFLKEQSLVPTENAFSALDKIDEAISFNFFDIFVVDLMHEVELGVWKSIFIHLIRIMQSTGAVTVNEFNRRFRKIGNFGRGTIRSFANTNITDMKNFAARNFEDVLQCIIPCFEGLLPEPHNTDIIRLLYILARWHGLAKLRLHTESTLKMLDLATTTLGREIRHFATTTCQVFETLETPKEYASRKKRQAAGPSRPGKGSKQSTENPGSSNGRKPKTFSMKTFKLHSLGHYVETIKRFGTTDSFSTQIGETCHRDPKRFYEMGSKGPTYVKEAALAHRRKVNVREITQNAAAAGLSRKMPKKSRKRHIGPTTKEDPLPLNSPYVHHHIGMNKNNWIELGGFIAENRDDPAVPSTFASDLRDHLLGRLHGRQFDGEEGVFTDDQRRALVINKNRLYKHACFRCNYTTYDVRRDQDIIHPNIPSRSFVMVSAAAGDHPFWYAKVLAIFHVEIFHGNNFEPNRMEFLWVRWMGEDPDHIGSDKKVRLHRIGYVPASDDGSGAFGFLDPSLIIRGCHLIPAFSFGHTKELLQSSRWWDNEELGDYVNYYVNPFVDRDMLMRYIGHGVGHVMFDATTASLEKGDAGGSMEETDNIPHNDSGIQCIGEPGCVEEVDSDDESGEEGDLGVEEIDEAEELSDVDVDDDDDHDPQIDNDLTYAF